jgi:hypothetical protein
MKKNKLITIIFLTLFLGIPFIIFLNKCNQLGKFLEQEKIDNKQSFLQLKNSYLEKYIIQNPNNKTLFNDYFDINDAEIKHYTNCNFFIYRKRLSQYSYPESYYECLIKFCEIKIQNSGIENTIQKRIQALMTKYGENSITYFENIGFDSFINKQPSIDSCNFSLKSFLFEINNTAFNEFDLFFRQFKEDESECNFNSIKSIQKFEQEKNKTILSLNKKGIELLNENLSYIELINEEIKHFSFIGEIIGEINYSFSLKSFDVGKFNSMLSTVNYHTYINNSLFTGATPYSICYGSHNSCPENDCSELIVKTPSNSDVLVIIKKNGNVKRHAYIEANSSFTFHLANGIYQPFFYYGQGWNPNKKMNSKSCKNLIGGFISDEYFSKDFSQELQNTILTYELILQQNGNFSTKPSSSEETF